MFLQCHGSGLIFETFYITRRCASIWRGPRIFRSRICRDTQNWKFAFWPGWGGCVGGRLWRRASGIEANSFSFLPTSPREATRDTKRERTNATPRPHARQGSQQTERLYPCARVTSAAARARARADENRGAAPATGPPPPCSGLHTQFRICPLNFCETWAQPL